LWLIAASGCVGLNTFQSANTLGEGGLQVSVEPSVWGGGKGARPYVYPRLDLSARYGLRDRVDVGFRLGSAGFELQSKFQVTRPDEVGFILSFAPSVGGFFLPVGTPSGASMHLTLPVLLGFGLSGGHQLVLGPKVMEWVVAGNDEVKGGHALYAGASVGLSLKLGETFRVMPELGVVYPIVSNLDSHLDVDKRPLAGYLGYQFGVAFLFLGG
jgi:hypothetical protein